MEAGKARVAPGRGGGVAVFAGIRGRGATRRERRFTEEDGGVADSAGIADAASLVPVADSAGEWGFNTEATKGTKGTEDNGESEVVAVFAGISDWVSEIGEMTEARTGTGGVAAGVAAVLRSSEPARRSSKWPKRREMWRWASRASRR